MPSTQAAVDTPEAEAVTPEAEAEVPIMVEAGTLAAAAITGAAHITRVAPISPRLTTRRTSVDTVVDTPGTLTLGHT